MPGYQARCSHPELLKCFYSVVSAARTLSRMPALEDWGPRWLRVGDEQQVETGAGPREVAIFSSLLAWMIWMQHEASHECAHGVHVGTASAAAPHVQTQIAS
jgi:hypothetical protein